jgi:hypothetical protein
LKHSMSHDYIHFPSTTNLGGCWWNSVSLFSCNLQLVGDSHWQRRLIILLDTDRLVGRDNIGRQRSRTVTHFIICRNKNVYFEYFVFSQSALHERASSIGVTSDPSSISKRKAYTFEQEARELTGLALPKSFMRNARSGPIFPPQCRPSAMTPIQHCRDCDIQTAEHLVHCRT